MKSYLNVFLHVQSLYLCSVGCYYLFSNFILLIFLESEELPAAVKSEVGSLPDMSSPSTLTFGALRSLSPHLDGSSDTLRSEVGDSVVNHISAHIQETTPSVHPVQDITQALREALSESDDEFGEEWVMENRPLSFIE